MKSMKNKRIYKNFFSIAVMFFLISAVVTPGLDY